jgi:hypothetical protein
MPASNFSTYIRKFSLFKVLDFSLFVEQYMGQPEIFASIPVLAPGQSVELPVTALFNEAMLGLTENSTANGQVLVSYRSLGIRKKTSFSIQIPVYHRNALTWDDDRRAAAFVSARDPSARLFARYTAQTGDMRSSAEDIPQNVQYAAALFGALAAYGINYVIDPNSSFIEMSENAMSLDSINYPYQTLYFRGGDCDDLSILFCSLLEALGIQTAFITIPGHIYMAFETGDSEWRAAANNIIDYDGKRWMPVEITVLDEGFYRAWQIGASEWQNAKTERRLLPVREAWAVYPSVSVPAGAERLPRLPDEAEIIRAFERELRLLK